MPHARMLRQFRREAQESQALSDRNDSRGRRINNLNRMQGSKSNQAFWLLLEINNYFQTKTKFGVSKRKMSHKRKIDKTGFY